jgi:hypothetical protein
MSRRTTASLALLTLVFTCAGVNSASAQNWNLLKIERSDQGVVAETKLNPISGLTETKNMLVFGKKNEFLKLSIAAGPDKRGAFPTALDFKLADDNGKRPGKQTFFLKGKDNVIIIYYQGDWTSLDGVTLEGPGGRTVPLGKKKK